jgi:hypothetical protein
MIANKAAYWIALLLFALALRSEYRQGKFAAIHRVVGRAESTLCRITAHAEQTLAMARMLAVQQPDLRLDNEFMARQQGEVERGMARHQAALDRDLAEHQAEVERAMALRQAELDRLQERLDQMHVVLDRSQLPKVRLLTRTRFKLSGANRHMLVVCPRTSARITVHTGDLDADIADLGVGDSN